MKKIIFFLLLCVTAINYGQVIYPKVDKVNRRLIFDSEKHLQDFIEYYSSDSYQYDFDFVIKELTQKGFFSLLNMDHRIKLYESGKLELTDETGIDEDEDIADDRFASLLNTDREIKVGNKVFKYIKEGLLYTTKNKMNQTFRSKKELILSPSGYFKDEPQYRQDDDTYFVPFEYYRKKTVNKSGSKKVKRVILPDPFYNLNYCQFDDSGFWESLLPGSKEVCISKITKRRRIKTVFSDQNFLIFASTYAKVKSQKKHKLKWWYNSNICDYLELGRTVVIKFPLEYPSLPSLDHNFLIRDNSGNRRIIDQTGEVIQYLDLPTNTDLFEKFPFDNSSFNYEIYVDLGILSFPIELESKDINKLISKTLGKFIKATGEDLNKNPIKIAMTIKSGGFVYFVEYGEKTRRSGKKIRKTYDVNFLISFKSSFENFLGDIVRNLGPGSFLNAKSYEVALLDVYGLGLCDGYIYGSRIGLGNDAEDNIGKYDSDGDGVPDIKDYCVYQPGELEYNGCPYSLLKNAVHRIKNKSTNSFSKSNNSSNSIKIGSCFNLEIRPSDFPLKANSVGGEAKFYEFIAGNRIRIDGASKVKIKPEGNTRSISLKIKSDACDITGVSNQKNNQVNLKKNDLIIEDHVLKSKDFNGQKIIISPNPFDSEDKYLSRL